MAGKPSQRARRTACSVVQTTKRWRRKARRSLCLGGSSGSSSCRRSYQLHRYGASSMWCRGGWLPTRVWPAGSCICQVFSTKSRAKLQRGDQRNKASRWKARRICLFREGAPAMHDCIRGSLGSKPADASKSTGAVGGTRAGCGAPPGATQHTTTFHHRVEQQRRVAERRCVPKAWS